MSGISSVYQVFDVEASPDQDGFASPTRRGLWTYRLAFVTVALYGIAVSATGWVAGQYPLKITVAVIVLLAGFQQVDRLAFLVLLSQLAFPIRFGRGADIRFLFSMTGVVLLIWGLKALFTDRTSPGGRSGKVPSAIWSLLELRKGASPCGVSARPDIHKEQWAVEEQP